VEFWHRNHILSIDYSKTCPLQPAFLKQFQHPQFQSTPHKTWSRGQKVLSYKFVRIFAKYWLIFKFFSPAHFVENLQ